MAGALFAYAGFGIKLSDDSGAARRGDPAPRAEQNYFLAYGGLERFGDRSCSGILLLSRAQSRAVRAQQHGAQQHSMSVTAADVFLSYSRTDTPAVRQIQAYLKQAGLATFLDRDQLPAGQSWLSALEQAIAAARRSPAMPPQKCCDCEKMLRLRKKIRLIV